MGYWMTTDEGVTAHVNGDPDASQESKDAIEAVINAAAKAFAPTANCDMCRRYELVSHDTDNHLIHYWDHWHAGHFPSAYGRCSRIARMRRGKWVAIPAEWRGRTTDPSTIRKRQSKHPKKLRRINNTGERLARNELRAPIAEEWE